MRGIKAIKQLLDFNVILPVQHTAELGVFESKGTFNEEAAVMTVVIDKDHQVDIMEHRANKPKEYPLDEQGMGYYGQIRIDGVNIGFVSPAHAEPAFHSQANHFRFTAHGLDFVVDVTGPPKTINHSEVMSVITSLN
jgi:hypothetical protein